MIWLTWRQFRTQGAVAFGALVLIAIALGVTGPHLVHLFDTTVAPCRARGDCAAATTSFLSKDRILQDLGNVLVVLPAIVGVFWGAPLVSRELETGTERLVWTQSVSRAQWTAVKLGVVGLGSVAFAGLFSWMLTWWSNPFDRINMNQFTSVFDQRGVVPIGYAAFAFVLGVAAGVVIRRTLPAAMAATLAAFVGVRAIVALWIRPHLVAPVRQVSTIHLMKGMQFDQASGGPLTLTGAKPGSWVFSDQVVDKAGHAVGGSFLTHGACLVSRSSPSCIGQLREVLVYQPADRYWTFQWYETAIFVGLALVLAVFCFWWIRSRLS